MLLNYKFCKNGPKCFFIELHLQFQFDLLDTLHKCSPEVEDMQDTVFIRVIIENSGVTALGICKIVPKNVCTLSNFLSFNLFYLIHGTNVNQV